MESIGVGFVNALLDPQLIAQYQRRFPGIDDKIVSLYARGLSSTLHIFQ
jgi:transposase-like protein